jgi:hypothetical protein
MMVKLWTDLRKFRQTLQECLSLGRGKWSRRQLRNFIGSIVN